MEQLLVVLRAICRKVGSPVAEQVLDLAERGEWLQIQHLAVDPTSYNDSESYWADALCVDLVRKADLSMGVDTKAAAIDTFLETERACYSMNKKIRTLIKSDGENLSTSDDELLTFLLRWKEKIRSVLGKVPEVLAPKFSGGATTSTNRLWSTTLDKLSTTPEWYSHSVFDTAIWFYTCGWGAIAARRGLPPRVAPGNEYFVVPKNGLTGRSCCKEAVINLALQLSLGNVLRGRARKCLGIDLNHGQDLHVFKACVASVLQHLATLDMSSASDRWARELIRFLIDGEWLNVLNANRATHTLFGEKRLYLEKFSSMGNGFTFELETILFATLALVVQEIEAIPGEILCYGDDLIVPTGLAPRVLYWLDRVGHKPNLKKTHVSGPFRESCGGDFFKGIRVNTVKLEKVPSEPQHWISLANNLRRVAGDSPERWGLVLPAWRKCLDFLPSQIRECRGPEHLGDQVIHDREDQWKPRSVATSTSTRYNAVFGPQDPRNAGHYRQVRGYAPVVAKRRLSYYTEESGGLPAILASTMSAQPLSNGIALREVESYRLTWLYVDPQSEWLPTTEVRLAPESHSPPLKIGGGPTYKPYWEGAFQQLITAGWQ